MKVLVIAEDKTTLDEIRQSFRKDWPDISSDVVKVAECSRGEEGVAVVRSEPPDMLIIDGELPGITGLETLARIRRFSDVPVITLFSNRSDATQLVEALGYGADAYMVKPVRQMELLARVQALTRRRQAITQSPAHMRILRSSLATQ